MTELNDIETMLRQETVAENFQWGIAVHDHVVQRVRICASRRIAWLRKLWVESAPMVKGTESYDLHTEVDGYLRNNDSCFAENKWYQEEESIWPLNRNLEEVESLLIKDRTSRIALIKTVFGLNAAEMDIIQCCLALCIDPNLGRVYAYLHDHNGRGYVSNQLVGRLFNHEPFTVIGSSSPLMVWNLVKEIDMGRSEPARLELDPFVRNWLFGSNDLDPAISGYVFRQPIHLPLPDWPVSDTVKMIRERLAHEQQTLLRIFLPGQEGTGRRSFATIVCSRLGIQMLTIKTASLNPADWPAVFMKAQRQALFGNYAILWEGDMALENQWQNFPRLQRLQFTIGEADEAPLAAAHIVDMRLNLPGLSIHHAVSYWKEFIPLAAGWPEDLLLQMLRRHQVTIGQMVTASSKNIRNLDEASEILRSISRHRLGDLAKQINSSFSWDDLVIPASLQNGLNDFYFEATERSVLWEEATTRKLFPQGRGLMALFSGSPGTGKTMAAQVIANSLQLDLFRIDLSSMISKYIGETSKNIQRILARAARMDIVLLFDEADALFGKRTELKDAHDRYANTDTNYLLQAIEEYPGIAILATNRKANIDTGFTRRLRYVLEFTKPDAVQRFQLWMNLVKAMAGYDQALVLENEIRKMAELVDVTGAQIKLAVLSAIYMSRRDKTGITGVHLMKGVERELVKEGRSLSKPAQELFKQQLVKEQYNTNGTGK